MTALPQSRTQILRLALEGERVRRATALLEREAPKLATALRRAVPFLARRGVPVAVAYARAVPVADLLREAAAPLYLLRAVAEPGGSRGGLLLDAGAIGLLLDGVLGGDGTRLPALNPAGLSAPQTALVARTADGILRSLSDVLLAALGLKLEPRPGGLDEAANESAPIALALDLGQPAVGQVVLLVPKETLLARASVPEEQPPRPEPVDPRMAVLLDGVEIDVVAELARVPMRLSEVANLRVGEVLRLDVAVGAPVTVRADGRVLLRGRPTSVSGRIAVRIDPALPRGHEA